MARRMIREAFSAAGFVMLLGVVAGCQGTREADLGQRIYIVTTENELTSFQVARPSVPRGPVAVKGLGADESLVGIDFRPANGLLYAVASSGKIYTIDTATAAAAPVSTISVALSGKSFGVDFNPVPDRLRLVSDAEQNLRINVDTGEATVDKPLAYAPTDAKTGVDPNVVAAGYTNSVKGAKETMLHVIDFSLGNLATQNPPNDGVLNTLGPLGTTSGPIACLDISGRTGAAMAILTDGNAGSSQAFSIDIATGAARAVGTIGRSLIVRDCSFEP
ncbi:MAG: DUF4394 domain-containing protein [Candidatus Binatia bacterium]